MPDPSLEVEVAPDGRIARVTKVSGHGRRSVVSLSSEGAAALFRGGGVLYRSDDERRLRGLPYLDVLETMRQEIRLTAHNVWHGNSWSSPTR
jgi:hypothetical protein